MTARPWRPFYYARSVLTLLAGVRLGSLVAVAGTVLGRPGPCLLRLRRTALAFMVRDLMDVWMIKEVCLDHDYERAGAPIEPGWVVLDIGAGIGEFAIDVAARHPTCTIHAFEPAPQTFELLCRNVRLNEVRNVRTHAVAVTGVSGVARLDVSSRTGVMHHILPGGSVSQDGIEVKASTLRDVLDESGVTACDFLKIDCEGGEYALLGSADRATLDRVSRICLEYHDGPLGTHDQLVDGLTAAGFRVSLTGSRAYRELGFLYAWKA